MESGIAKQVGEHLDVGSPQQLCAVLQEIAHADSRDQNGQRGSLTQGLIGQALNGNTKSSTYQHGQQHTQNRGQTKGRHSKETDVRTNHDDITMGKVQHFGNAVDHSITQGDDGVHAAQTDAVDQMVQEGQHKFTPQLSLFLKNLGSSEMTRRISGRFR